MVEGLGAGDIGAGALGGNGGDGLGVSCSVSAVKGELRVGDNTGH